MTEAELDRILTLQWPAVIRWAKRQKNEWLASFALSIAGKGKRKAWRPSPKQARVMRRMVAEQQADDARLLNSETELQVIEE